MVCEHCGAAAKRGAITCDQCGAMLPVSEMGKGAAALRQGRSRMDNHAKRGGAVVKSTEDAYLPLLDDRERTSRQRLIDEHETMKRAERTRAKKAHRPMVNWALLGVIFMVLVIMGVVGGFLYLNMTDTGQLVLARMGRDASATALWTLGDEYLDQGYIERAVNTYEKAYEQEPEIEGLYDYLLRLAEAYEAAARPGDAEEIYVKLYTEIDEKNPVAYRNIMRLMQDQGRVTQEAEFLKLAYLNTGDTTFKIRRDEMVPLAPTTSLEAGRHLMAKTVELSSPQDYDVYYIIGDEGMLPEDGQLYTEPFQLEEGGWTVRAVAVSSELVSDELNVRYVITMPVPDAPKANLAANSYERRQRVRLRNVGDDPNVTFYYTIDSSAPTINSPIYDDETGILLPGGRVTLRAVAVNAYGKVSNEMSVEYQINVSFKNYYRPTDTFSDFTIMSTTMEQFKRKFGEPVETKPIDDDAVRGICEELVYTWGSARFYYVESGAILYYFDMTGGSITGPRNTKFGMSEEDITTKFRDMGQANNQDGTRNIYTDSAGFYAKVFIIDEANKYIQYVYKDDSGAASVTLRYYLTNDRCTRITVGYAINK